MDRCFEYQGHRVEVSAKKVGQRWTWANAIDVKHVRRNWEDTLSTEKEALAYGASDARFSIDRMIRVK